MSHFTELKTCLQNFFYLEKTLTQLKIEHKIQKANLNNSELNLDFVELDLLIPQSNGHDLKFSWNGKSYDFIFDKDFWDQKSTAVTFLDHITQQYASELIVGESQKVGFQPIKYDQDNKNVDILILERWNSNLILGG